MHEPRHLAREAEDLILLDVDESDDDDDSFGDEAIRRYLGDDEARRGTPQPSQTIGSQGKNDYS